MATDSPVDGLTQDEYNYIAAVIEDENYEFDLDDAGEYSLFTDWEGDGEFFPSVTIMHSVADEETEEERQRVSDLTEGVDWFICDEVADIENDTTGDIAHAYFYGARIDDDVREAVAETL